MLAWHCIVSKPSQEARAAIELTNQDFHVFLPILDKKPMFPRYLFAEFDASIDNWGVIRSTRGCIDVLKNGRSPATVPNHVMAAVMAFKAPETLPDGQTEFSPGQSIQIVQGPLAGLQGLFVADKRHRVYCLLDLLGKKVEVARDSIRAA